jgi:hypothetical protein
MLLQDKELVNTQLIKSDTYVKEKYLLIQNKGYITGYILCLFRLKTPKTAILHPWQCEAPGGAPPTKPAQGRATHKISVLRRGVIGSLVFVPPPRRRASPSIKKNRLGLLPPVVPLRSTPSGRKPFINGSQGEGQPPDVAGGR